MHTTAPVDASRTQFLPSGTLCCPLHFPRLILRSTLALCTETLRVRGPLVSPELPLPSNTHVHIEIRPCQPLALADVSTRTVHTLFPSLTGDTLPVWCHERSAILIVSRDDDGFAGISSPSDQVGGCSRGSFAISIVWRGLVGSECRFDI